MAWIILYSSTFHYYSISPYVVMIIYFFIIIFVAYIISAIYHFTTICPILSHFVYICSSYIWSYKMFSL